MSEGSLINRNLTLAAALILSLGIVIGGYLLGDGLRRARMADRSVTVRGLAERNVNADLATWNISFAAQGTEGFYPLVTVVCEIADPAAHYHVPLLISPYGYSTYRGS